MDYVVWGWAIVFNRNGKAVNNRKVLSDLSSFVDEGDLFATDFLGGNEAENSLATALNRSGQLRFALYDDEKLLRVMNLYNARRQLNESELLCLRKYTLGQWSDGMGENIWVPSGVYAKYKLQPIVGLEVTIPNYPFVEIRNS